MEELAIKRALRIMFREWKQDNSRASFHYAFALRKSKVVAIGKNNISDGSRTALKIGRSLNINKWKEYPYLHAECDVINQIKDKYSPNEIIIISLRINRTGQYRLAKPCQHCQKVLDILGYYNVWWSLTNEDKSGRLVLSNDEESIKF
jgi:tRNA(Arg) A34 adenosine deaminase TadA